MKEIKEFKYRPEVDGLRAIAVLAVVMFHAGLGIPGGYVGVDVFFVISGYLITTLVVRDLVNGRFTMLDFWHRRIKRIFPALTVMVLSVLIAGWVCFLPFDYFKLANSTVYQALMIANVYFWKHVGYFSGSAEEMPLLHTWSLAVEEQFYVLMPLFLLACYKLSKGISRKVLVAALSVLLLVSLIFSVYAVNDSPSAAFYLLPSRAWEMLLGSLVALLPCLRIGAKFRELVSWVGILMILGACLFFQKTTTFPGMAALLPCLGTAFFLKGTQVQSGHESICSAAKLLSCRAVVFIGLISYSLYLWHWPVFAFAQNLAAGHLGPVARLGLVALSFVLAVFSWKFVEVPFRRGFSIRSRKVAFCGAAIWSCVIIALAFAIRQNDGFKGRWSVEVMKAVDARNDHGYVYESQLGEVSAGDVVLFGAKEATGPPWGLVWGDSFAMAAMPAFEEYATEHGLKGVQITRSATAPLIDYYMDNEYGLAERAVPFNQAVLEYVRASKVENVFLVACWSSYLSAQYGANMNPKESLMQTVELIVAAGSKPWIVLRPPKQSIDVPAVLARSRINAQSYEHLLAEPDSYTGLFKDDDGFITLLEEAGAGVINPRPYFLSNCQNYYVVEKDGDVLYRDRGHLTSVGARRMLLPAINGALESGAN